MVDFKKRLGKSKLQAPIDPIQLYETLDRASDKGPLRPAQQAVLQEWHDKRRSDRDLIIKLHTGQGKTLIGQVILQSKLNSGEGPAVYLCPNNHLVAQTVAQAKQFGLRCVTADPELPTDFLDSNAILITSVQKLFNGLTKFGLGSQSLSIGAMVMDDSHACIDAIRDACTVRLAHSDQAYSEILALFAVELEKQGVGTFADIRRNRPDALLAVPYWEWIDKHAQVADILSNHTSVDAIKFVWPVLKDKIRDCLCIVSGTEMEITPYLPPLDLFGSYHRAGHRVFMSATVTNDSFLVKGLGLAPDVITNPLTYSKETWAGEKMILIPSLIDSRLERDNVVAFFARPATGRKVGVVALAPSTYRCQDWGKYGSIIANKKTIEAEVSKLLQGRCENTLVIVNRYDGIDLPDDACRILIFDSKPHSENLVDMYVESCRPDSDIIQTRTARMIEQGLGRSVRGEKDYCVFVLIGASLIKSLRTQKDRTYFSPQTRTQIEIGLEIAEYAKEEIAEGTDEFKALISLVNQCLKRDSGWKEYYVERMNQLQQDAAEPSMLEWFEAERNAELQNERGNHDRAVATINALLDNHISETSEQGWYLQDIARYKYLQSKAESNQVQVKAHSLNRYLLKPKHGAQFKKVALLPIKRVERIKDWVAKFKSFQDLQLVVDEILDNLQFGIAADDFENALNRLAGALGYEGDRPDKEWKEGPDNLWALRDNEYMFFECKSEVDVRRSEISKNETGQMNNACAWFNENYGNVPVTRILIIPPKHIARGAGFVEPVVLMRNHHLKKFVSNVSAFYRELSKADLGSIDDATLGRWLEMHELSTDQIVKNYSESPVYL